MTKKARTHPEVNMCQVHMAQHGTQSPGNDEIFNLKLLREEFYECALGDMPCALGFYSLVSP